SEPSSRTSLTGEQPDPWDLLQPQDEMSRHRGAKPRRLCELLGAISLLSPGYLLSDSAADTTLMYECPDSGKLTPTFVPVWVVALTVKLAYAYTLSVRFPSEPSQPLNAS